MVKALFDTNIPADYLNAVPEASARLTGCKFATTLQVISPSGKSAGRFFDPLVKPLLQKYSVFPKCKIRAIVSSSRPERGALRNVTKRGAGCGGRGWCRRRRRLSA